MRFLPGSRVSKSDESDKLLDSSDSQPNVRRSRSAASPANFEPLLCHKGHEVTKHKQGRRWHQGWVHSRFCDVCKKKLGEKENCWRCEHHCDYNVCEDCYDRRPEKELVTEALWSATQARDLDAIDAALQQASEAEVSDGVQAMMAAKRARQHLLRRQLAAATSHGTLKELQELLGKVIDADVGGWRDEVQQARARIEVLERLERQISAKVALRQVWLTHQPLMDAEVVVGGWGSQIMAMTVALEQAQALEVTRENCKEVVAVMELRECLVKRWLRSVTEEKAGSGREPYKDNRAIWTREAHLDEVLAAATAIGLDDSCAEVVSAQAAKRELFKWGLRAAIPRIWEPEALRVSQGGPPSQELRHLEEIMARACVAGLDNASVEMKDARKAKEQLSKNALRAALRRFCAWAELSSRNNSDAELMHFQEKVAGDGVQNLVNKNDKLWIMVPEALAFALHEGVEETSIEIVEAKALLANVAKVLLRTALASNMFGDLEAALDKASTAGLHDTCEEVQMAKAAQAQSLVFHCRGAQDFNLSDASSPSLKLTEGFTVMIWVRRSERREFTVDRGGPGVRFARVIGKGRVDCQNYGLWIAAQTGRITGQVGTAPMDKPLEAGDAHTLPVDQWTHIAMSFTREGRHELIVNGRTVAIQQHHGMPRTSDDPLTLRKAPGFSEHESETFAGDIQDARVYKFAMTLEDILNVISPALKLDPVALLLSVPLDSPMPFAVKVQDAVDKDVVRGMVKPQDLNKELQLEQEIQSVPGGVDCFHCSGAGFLVPECPFPLQRAFSLGNDKTQSQGSTPAVLPVWIVEANAAEGGWEVYPEDVASALEEAMLDGAGATVQISTELHPEAVRSSIDLRQMLQTDVDEHGEEHHHHVMRLTWSGMHDHAEDESTPGGEISCSSISSSLADDSDPGTWLFDNGSGGWGVFNERTNFALECVRRFSESTKVWLKGPSFYSFWYLIDLGLMTQSNTWTGVTRRVHRIGSKAPDISPSTKEGDIQCWVCSGTGKTSKWLSSSEVRRDEEEHPCLICFCDSQYGMSVECDHYYCDDCIRGSLDAILNSGQFPALCPQCRADAGGEPTKGWITPPALTFLQKRDIITKEFQFRFVTAGRRALRETTEDFFECPAGCGNFLIAQEASYILMGDEPKLRLGECPCGTLICVQCKNIVERDKEHVCEKDPFRLAAREAERQRDEAAFAALAAIGKKCPVCSMFIQKNEGCDWMTCGTAAHGKLADALRNGGCGIAFQWGSLKVADDPSGWHDFNGHKRGRPVTARQIKEHPKCARPECPFFKTVDDLGPGIVAPTGLTGFHTAVGTQARNNGGEYCCGQCAQDGNHSNLCHKIRYDERHRGTKLDKNEVKADSVSDWDKAPTKLFKPFEAQYVQLTWPRQNNSAAPQDGTHFHAQLLGEDRRAILAKTMHTNEKLWWTKAATELNFGRGGLVGSNWQVSCAFEKRERVLGIKTDAGKELPFTLHYSDDGVKWVPYVA